MPGEETSSVYWPAIGSCASSTGDRLRDIVCAFLHRDGAVRALGHDLHGRAVASRNHHPHQAKAEIAEHRLGQGRDLGSQAGLANEARVGRSAAHRLVSPARFEYRKRLENAQAIAQNKKSGPKGPTLRVEMIMSAWILGTNCADWQAGSEKCSCHGHLQAALTPGNCRTIAGESGNSSSGGPR